jgi:Flp pilus assembly protein TadD
MLKNPDGPTQRRLLSGIVKDPSPTGPAVTTLQTMSNLSQSNLSADDVLDGLRKLSNDLPRFLPAQMALTDAQLRLGRCSDAIDSASHAVQAFPTESQPAELAVKAFLQMERWSDALQMAQTWHDRLVGDPLAADLKIAQMELQFGDAAKCLATLQPHKDAPYATDLEKWETVGTEAQALVAQGKADEAVSTLWPDAQLTLSNQADWMKFVVASLPSDAAETWLNKIGDWLKTKPQFAASQIKLASTWDLLAEKSGDKRYAKTGRDLVHQLESDPQLAPEATCTEGEFDEEDRDFKGAQAAYRKAISLAQVSPLGHLTDAENNLAMLLAMHGGDLKEAVAVARQCVTDDPQATYYDTLATVLDKNHDYPGAAQAMQTALQLEPNNAKWYVNLAHLMMEQGKRADAKQLIAQLDLMTPGTRSFARLPQYQDELNTLRELLGSGPSTRP